MKKVLVILGHSSSSSLCASLAAQYCEGAEEAGSEVKQLNLGELNFAPFLDGGYVEDQVIEQDIIKAQDDIKWADHLVIVYPTWWSTPPALFKAFFERTMLPGFAYKYKKSKKVVAWDKYLMGKSARIISTMDSPPMYYQWVVGDPGFKMMKDILNFCGIKPVKKTYFGSVKMSTEDKRKKWLQACYKLGQQD